MDNKKLIESILKEHILNKNFYTTVFDVFYKEFGIDLFEAQEYKPEIDAYMAQLISRVSDYWSRIYSQEELIEMSLDINSMLYHRTIVTEYTDIITGETRVFSANLRNRFVQDGISKRSWLQKIIDYFN